MPAVLSPASQVVRGSSPFFGSDDDEALQLLFSPIFSSICLTKLAKGSEVLRAKTQTTGAEPYFQR